MRRTLIKRHPGACLLLIVCATLVVGCGDASENDDGTGDDPAPASMTFSDFLIADASARSLSVRFTTSAPTTCEIVYGLSEDDLSKSATDPPMGDDEYDIEYNIEYDVLVEDLLPETTYFFRARAADANGDTFSSELQTFTTPKAETNSARTNAATLSMGTVFARVSSNFGGAANYETWGFTKRLMA